MKIISNETGETIANILTNHSMTLDEALDLVGAEPLEAETRVTRITSLTALNSGTTISTSYRIITARKARTSERSCPARQKLPQ